MTKFKKTLKIIAGIVVFFTLPTLLLFGFLYLKYDTELPQGKSGLEAEQLADKMLEALDYKAYEQTDYMEWTFKRRHHYKWDKANKTCDVYWKNYRVHLYLNNPSQSDVFKDKQPVTSETKTELIAKAVSYFNNDSFWLVAPYKVKDPGTTRKLVSLPNGKNGLLVTYNSGGSTPGDSYLWHLDDSGKPVSFQMWVSILPIDGLEATWNDWTTTESGAILPTFHKFMVFGIEIDGIITR